ncbi:hypothetical protein J1605_022167 [Eschrichtius robustus]|uniref:Complexin-4 n=1 Tax=Eschrichtius robustus TaxID=9764 RepID=A0AB34HDH6_ESCRO|nr:hypothetical protein J1605_022167 [Eschrichtius robustus]
MAFLMKTMISSQVKNLGLGGRSEEQKEEGGTSDPAAAQGMTREEYEEYQKQVIEEKNPPGPHMVVNQDQSIAEKPRALVFNLLPWLPPQYGCFVLLGQSALYLVLYPNHDGKRCCIYTKKGREGVPQSSPQRKVQTPKEPVLCNKRSHRNEKPVLCNKRSHRNEKPARCNKE